MDISLRTITLSNYRELINPKRTPHLYNVINTISINVLNKITVHPKLYGIPEIVPYLEFNLWEDDLSNEEDQLTLGMREVGILERNYQVLYRKGSTELLLYEITASIRCDGKSELSYETKRHTDKQISDLRNSIISEKLSDFLSEE